VNAALTEHPAEHMESYLDILDISAGIENSAEDKSFYIEVLQLYLEDAKDWYQQLDEFLKDGDMKNYAIIIHALKSNLRLAGANSVSETAYQLELHSKDGDLEYVKEHHPQMMKQAASVEKAILQYLSENS